MMAEPEQDASRQRLDSELALLWRRLRWMGVTLAREIEDGLEAPAYGLLGAICDTGAGLRASELADKFGLDRSTVSRQIAQMERLGLLERVPDPHDGRARLVRVTVEGQDRMRRLRDRRGRWFDDALREWPSDDVRHLVELLARLNASLESPQR